jgi:hypothetical protein
MGGKAPDAPDPYVTAQAQADANRLNQYTPTGNVEFGSFDESGNFVPNQSRYGNVRVSSTPGQEALQRQGEGLCEEALNLTLDALLELRNAGADRDKAIRHLELAAAMAITTINTLRQE